jgi:Fic family protein
MLCERGSLPQPLLYLSTYLERHDRAYRDHLLRISQAGAWNDWIGFFAQGVAEQARDAVLRATRMLELQQAYRARVQQVSQSTALLRLVDQLFAAPFITIVGAALLLEQTHRAASQNVMKLLEQGILRDAAPGRKRRRVYVAAEILELLEAELQPGVGE